MVNENFYAALQQRFRQAATCPCLTEPGRRRITYAELDALSAGMAGLLLGGEAKPGDRILVQVDKSIENVALYFGAMRAGLVYVPLNTAYTSDEVEYFLNDAQPSVFVCSPEKVEALSPPAKQAGAKHIYALGPDGSGSLCEALDAAGPYDEIHPRHEDDLAVILYTSGTTGRSKGAMLSHGNLASNAMALNELWGFSSADVLLHALPIFHIHGLFVALHTAILSTCEILFLPKFDIGNLRQAMPRASVMMGVPTFYTRLLAEENFTRDEAAHMRLFISGSAPLTEETFNAFAERTGHKILERYGMSEAGMIASNPLDGERIAGTVGYALPDVSIRVRGDQSEALAPGNAGNVEVKGPNIFKGYWRKPEKTAEEFTSDEFFKTGDNGALDETGRLTLMGRSKDLIIAGGYNIYPKEIEQTLDAVPGVSESAVVGVPHPDMGEGVIAILVADADPLDDDILAQALEALARFKRPRKFFWTDALPRNAMGKVQKQKLRENYRSVFAK